MINIRNIENLLEVIGKTACVIAAVSSLIWAYKEGSLCRNLLDIVSNLLAVSLFALYFILLNKSSHYSICKFVGFKFPYIIYLLPFAILIVFLAMGLAESAYYGYNANLNR